MFRLDPGPCIVCGAAHAACGPTGPIVVAQLPATDAAVAMQALAPVAAAVQATLPPGQFTTGTYRRPKKGRP